jgi:hypothetical protein
MKPNREDDHEKTTELKQMIFEDGYPMPKQPKEKIDWTLDVARLPPEELTRQMAYWSSWAGYTRAMLAAAEVNESFYKRQADLERGKQMISREKDFKTVTALKASIDQSEEIQYSLEKASASTNFGRLLKALLTTYEDREKILSREISRRNMEYESSRNRRMQ